MNREIKQHKIIQHVHDGDCPECGFPETIFVRDAETHELLKEKCSKKCGWEKFYKINQTK